jgi:hypothetical protein
VVESHGVTTGLRRAHRIGRAPAAMKEHGTVIVDPAAITTVGKFGDAAQSAVTVTG